MNNKKKCTRMGLWKLVENSQDRDCRSPSEFIDKYVIVTII